MKILTRFFVAVLFTIPQYQSYSQFHADSSHCGVFSNSQIFNGVELKWRLQTNGAVRSTPAVLEKVIIVGSSDGNVYCINRNDGSLKWKFTAAGAVNSTPMIIEQTAYFVCRKNILYAVNISNGSLQWKKNLGTPLPYVWGFDYYSGSPAIDGNTMYVGSANGNMYALRTNDGEELWTLATTSPIRSTPAIDERNIYFGDCSGKFFAVNKKNGRLIWQFNSIGEELDNEKFGFDRKAIIASAVIDKEKIIFGGRDGYLYALKKSIGTELWKYDYQISWIISTAAVKNTMLVTGTSDGQFINSINVDSGKELWRFQTNGPVWASPSISGNDVVIVPGNDGYVYALKLQTGEELWRYKIGPQIFSSAIPRDNDVYFGSDDGSIYALTTKSIQRQPIKSIKRAVFWTKEPIFQAFRNGMDVYVRDYFIREGYDFYDETDVKDFLLKQIHNDTASVIVFASNYFLPSIIQDTLGSNIFQEYLKTGGKAVFLGMNPAVYQIDYEKKQFGGFDFSLSKKISGIEYQYKDLRSHGGFYASFITDQGKQWGLRHNFVGVAGMPIHDIDVPLAVDDNGNASAWVKKFSTRNGSGFVQLFLTPDRLIELPEIQKAAEYGLR